MSVLLALLLDRLYGELPTRVHPVAWVGRYLTWAGRGLPERRPGWAFFGGAGWWLIGAIMFTGIFLLAARGLAQLPWWLSVPGTAVLLKPLFALRMLGDEVRAVETALGESLEGGRHRLSRIVSRDTTQLSATEVRESALESLSENLSDSVVAPLFWFAIAGLPGAALYRFANTADAMWGYRGRWEWAGKWAARADDVLNLVPARLTALLLWLPHLARVRFGQVAREAGKTPSPNSGWPMAALAHGLNVRLGKPGVYVLHPQGCAPAPTDTARALRHATLAAWITAVAIVLSGALLKGNWHA